MNWQPVHAVAIIVAGHVCIAGARFLEIAEREKRHCGSDGERALMARDVITEMPGDVRRPWMRTALDCSVAGNRRNP